MAVNVVIYNKCATIDMLKEDFINSHGTILYQIVGETVTIKDDFGERCQIKITHKTVGIENVYLNGDIVDSGELS